MTTTPSPDSAKTMLVSELAEYDMSVSDFAADLVSEVAEKGARYGWTGEQMADLLEWVTQDQAEAPEPTLSAEDLRAYRDRYDI